MRNARGAFSKLMGCFLRKAPGAFYKKHRVIFVKCMGCFSRKAPILLLDEAFSNLDAKSERIILLELSKILQSTTSKTVVAISHQLESLSWVDQILVLKDGRVREVGTFDELSKKNGVFQSMLRQKKTT